MTKLLSSRNTTIDILRGIAIFTMVAANLSSSLLQAEDKVFAFRLYGTFAAPLFILLAGMMVVITQARHGGFTHYLKRGLLIIGFACLLDLTVWQTWPLLGYDVLYLTGLAIPMIYVLACYCSITVRLVIASLFVLVTPLLQRLFAYREELISFELNQLNIQEYLQLLGSASTLQRLLLDGWFPLLPWLSFAIIGSILGTRYVKGYSLAAQSLLSSGLVLAAAGIAIWCWQQPHLVIRDGYSELFYPPSMGYFLTACGLILLGFYAVEKTRHLPVYGLFLNLGHASLFMYIFHQIILVAVLKPIPALNNQPLWSFSLTYLVVIAVMIATGYGLARVKQAYKNMPFILRFLIGG
ncbi:MAG: heparan-alpha-glucosaminide N-acetyltransferase domain-containing protein [Methylovulum sp.]|uniref:heparan-alpha-glucosaminide N-acetyltransferase domain-containing protein n=1 Tax=Methylovulum sp. TaxID=1916980 RepID=UPI00262E8FA8|nr:heparan-alpha-glucosaminide N-acetyltransferase domain-containing protein [Methylovulum sp.]MDD2724836.1 heparan-alpha-glucosaminide N-acetyltransferase domain-containing protein [Methylovulum sp.]MDD5124952.1 heparan-alpha-glucosaminide N-acetyltransferase domain-containing protein [Methylovulum sp.]